MEVASLPRTPGTALRAFAAQSDARSTVARRSRSASIETPMEGVPERSGFVLQPKTPKTPALVPFTSSRPPCPDNPHACIRSFACTALVLAKNATIHKNAATVSSCLCFPGHDCSSCTGFGLIWNMRRQAFTPMEGVPERLDPMLPATCARRRLHTTTPGPRRALGSVAADGRLLTPGDAAVLASGGDPDHDSPVEGLLQQSPAVGHQVLHSFSCL